MDAADHYRVLTMAHPELREKHGPAKLRALVDKVGLERACEEVQRLCGTDFLAKWMVARIQTMKETA